VSYTIGTRSLSRG